MTTSALRSWTSGDLCRELRVLFSAPPYAIGDSLPSELALSREFHAHRATVRRAMLMLAEQGIVRRDGPRAWTLRRPVGRSVADGPVAVLSYWPQEAVSSIHGGLDPAVERAVLRALHRHGRDVHYPHLKRGSIAALVSRLGGHAAVFASGGICADPDGAALLQGLRQAGLAVIAQGGSSHVLAFDRVVGDHAAGTALLVRHLAARGCSRLLRVWQGASRPWWLEQRDRGYVAAAQELGLPVVPELFFDEALPRTAEPDAGNFERRVRHAAGWLVDRLDGVDAILTVTDWSAAVILGALGLLGRRLPVVGYDNVWKTAWELERVPTRLAATVEKRNDLVGEAMVALMLERLSGTLGTEPQCRVVLPELVVLAES